MLYLVFDIEAGLGIDKDLNSLNFSLGSSLNQKGATILWAIAVS